jgi:chemotaxis signal transduction protein
MKDALATSDFSGDRLLTFEVASAVYGLPISVVLEVAEADRATCVPGLPLELVAVMNWHGDALPLVASEELLAGLGEDSGGDDELPVDLASDEAAVADVGHGAILKEQILVVSDGGDESAALGMPVDRVIGLVNGTSRSSRSANVVAERRSVDGRVVHVLDPCRLVARAGELIERAVGATAAAI